MTSEEEFAWACGLFEGEGCVHFRGVGRAVQRHLSVSSTDLDVLERFAAIARCGTIGPPRFFPDRKPLYRWTAGRWCEMAPLVQRMLPFMGERRAAKMREFLAFAPKAHPNTFVSERDALVMRYRVWLGEPSYALAEEYGISQAQVSRIKHRKRRPNLGADQILLPR